MAYRRHTSRPWPDRSLFPGSLPNVHLWLNVDTLVPEPSAWCATGSTTAHSHITLVLSAWRRRPAAPRTEHHPRSGARPADHEHLLALRGTSTRFETRRGVLTATPLSAWMPRPPPLTRELGRRSYDLSSRAIKCSTGPGSDRGPRWSGPAAPASRRSLGPSPGLARPGFPARR